MHALIFSLLTFAGPPKFHEGQRWSYKTRKGEEKSTVLILKIEEHPKLGVIFHVRLDGLRIANPAKSESPHQTLEHTPISREAFAASVIKLLDEKAKIPDFSAGYEDWKKANGGVFTLPLAKIVETIEQGLARH